MKILERNADGVRTLRLAWQKARSIAAENGYADLAIDLDPAMDERMLEILLSYEDGTRELDVMAWFNLVSMVRRSGSWGITLVSHHADIPETEAILAELTS